MNWMKSAEKKISERYEKTKMPRNHLSPRYFCENFNYMKKIENKRKIED